MLNKWLPSSENQLPASASHQALPMWCHGFGIPKQLHC